MENNQEQDALKLLIDALRADEIGLNDSRNALLARVPQPDDWAVFNYCTDGRLCNYETDEPAVSPKP